LVLSAQQSGSWDGNIRDGVAALHAANYAQAVQFLSAAYEQAQAFPSVDLRRANTSHLLAMAHQFLGHFDRAEPLYLESKSISEALGQSGRPLLGYTLDALGQLRFEQERWAEAADWLNQAIGVCTRALSEEDSCTLNAKRHLGELYSMQGQMEEAQALLLQVIDAAHRSKSPLGLLLPTALRDQAYIYALRGQYRKAEPMLKEALELSNRSGLETSTLADNLLPMGRLYRMQNDLARAEPLLDKATRIYEKANDPCLAHALHELGLLALAEGKYATARQRIERSISIYQKYLGVDHINIAFARVGLAETYLGEHNYTEAESLIQQAIAKEKKFLNESHYELARAYMVAAKIDQAQRRDTEADANYRQALAIYRKSLPSDNPDLAKAEQQYNRFAKSLRK
jgi:tetratricopeptide (TPR) repeat protein